LIRCLALLLPPLIALAACEAGPTGTRDAGSRLDDGGRLHVDADPALDQITPVRRGPYLQAPAPGTLTVSWATDAPSTSRVALVPEGGAVSEHAGPVFLQRPTTDASWAWGTLPGAYQHEVTLAGLEPGRRYGYRVLSVATEDASGAFLGPPGPGDDLGFFVYGDTQSIVDDHEAVVAALVDRMDLDGQPRAFALIAGDLVGGGGSEMAWDGFFAIEAPLVARVPLLPVVGNHDASSGRTLFEGIFAAPPGFSGTDRWYVAELGDVVVAVLDVWTPGPPGLREQFARIEAALAASVTPLRILALHDPLFSRSSLPDDKVLDLRDALLPLIARTGVQLVLSGHNHLYERFVGDGCHFVTTGGGGAVLYDLDLFPDADNLGYPRRAAASMHHFLDARVTGGQLRVEAIAVPDATRIDCFVVDPDAPGAEVGCAE
jgi:3',5'-cyclic AMP phosphodiesterase CpdA